jgi:hypothetical protein
MILTNIVLLSTCLVTNIQTTRTVPAGHDMGQTWYREEPCNITNVTRISTIGYKDGTNSIPIGELQEPMK